MVRSRHRPKVEGPLLIMTVLNANDGKSSATVKDLVAGALFKKRHVFINKPTGAAEKSLPDRNG